MRILTAFLFVPLVLAGGASAREVQITVYNNDLGLVRDVRDVELPAGAGDLSVTDVAAQIDPTSVHLKSLTRDGGITVLEQNYRYDLASPDRILERYLDRPFRWSSKGANCTRGNFSPSRTSSSC